MGNTASQAQEGEEEEYRPSKSTQTKGVSKAEPIKRDLKKEETKEKPSEVAKPEPPLKVVLDEKPNVEEVVTPRGENESEDQPEKQTPEEENLALRKQIDDLHKKLLFLSQDKIDDEEIRRIIIEKDLRVTELEKKLEEEGKERAKLLARIDKGGLKTKKPSMAQSIIQWEKDQIEKEKNSAATPDGKAPAHNVPPALRKNQTMVVEERPIGPLRSSTSGSLWAKGMQESRLEIQRAKKEISKPKDFIMKLQDQPNLTFLKSLENKIARSSDEWLLEFMNN